MRRRGFTLIELLVTLAIVVILTTLSIALLINLTQQYRLTTATENLYATLQYARSEAIKRNTAIYVSFVSGDNWCYGVNINSACNCSIANNCNLGSTNAAATQQLSLSTSGLSGNAIYFEGTQGTANASGSVTFTLYGQSTLMTVNIGRLGNLQLCATGVSGYTAC